MISKLVYLLTFSNLGFFAYAAISCSWDCSVIEQCAVVTSSSVTGSQTLKRVTVDYSGCDLELFSWACCTGTSHGMDNLSCTEETCNGVPFSSLCTPVNILTYLVPIDATLINVQVHDGRLNGDIECSDQACCGPVHQNCGTRLDVCNLQFSIPDF